MTVFRCKIYLDHANVVNIAEFGTLSRSKDAIITTFNHVPGTFCVCWLSCVDLVWLCPAYKHKNYIEFPLSRFRQKYKENLYIIVFAALWYHFVHTTSNGHPAHDRSVQQSFLE